MAMVEAKFRLLQMPIERFSGDPVDVVGSSGEFVLAMINKKVSVEAQVDQTVVPSPSIGVDEALQIGLATDHRLEDALARIGNDFRTPDRRASEARRRSFFHRRHGLSFPGSGADRKPGEG